MRILYWVFPELIGVSIIFLQARKALSALSSGTRCDLSFITMDGFLHPFMYADPQNRGSHGLCPDFPVTIDPSFYLLAEITAVTVVIFVAVNCFALYTVNRRAKIA